jgi:hypothetical protein
MKPNVFALSDLERAMEAAGKAGSLELVVVTLATRKSLRKEIPREAGAPDGALHDPGGFGMAGL